MKQCEESKRLSEMAKPLQIDLGILYEMDRKVYFNQEPRPQINDDTVVTIIGNTIEIFSWEHIKKMRESDKRYDRSIIEKMKYGFRVKNLKKPAMEIIERRNAYYTELENRIKKH